MDLNSSSISQHFEGPCNFRYGSLITDDPSKFDDRIVEPNSQLGGPIKYLLKHRKALMAFCHYEGAPLDNNLQENKLRLVVLHRKNALFFKEEIGAKVADVIMSVCAIAVSAGVNVHEYLIELQRNKTDVKENPGAYLP